MKPQTLLQSLRSESINLLTAFGAMAGMFVGLLAIVLLAVLAANGIQVDSPNRSVPSPIPLGPDGVPATDRFYFMHRPLVGDGAITARLAPLTGIITYPPPTHDQIVAGVVPWAKAGVIIKESTKQGSPYAAMMLTGGRGVRMQSNFSGDVAGSIDAAAAKAPVWLRLTRSGDLIRGYESVDGAQWTEVGSAKLQSLAPTAEIGLFVASPGDLTVSQGASRFTQATGVFDQVSVEGNAQGAWSREAIGSDGGMTDWERFHRPAGVTEAAGTFTVTGSGDIAPGFDGPSLGLTLIGTLPGLIAVLVSAVLFATWDYRSESDTRPRLTRTVLAAKAAVIGMAAFVVGCAGILLAVSLGTQIFERNHVPFAPVGALTAIRVAVGTGALFALSAILALSLGIILRRKVLAVLAPIAVVVLPYVLALGLLAPGAWQWDLRLAVSQWLLRVTPAAAFAVTQTVPEYPQVIGLYIPAAGYFPLSPSAGLAILGGYVVTFGLVTVRRCSKTG